MRYRVLVQTIGRPPPSMVSFNPIGWLEGERVRSTLPSLFRRGDGFQYTTR
jgi:hypothetical protein